MSRSGIQPRVSFRRHSIDTYDPDWRRRADCRHQDPELFFPVGDTGPAVLQTQAAKYVCRGCPVMESCLRWALDTNQEAGVWGGMSEKERRALKRKAARVRATA